MDVASPYHEAARRALDAARTTEAWGIPMPAAVEFWSVATRRLGPPPLATSSEATAFLQALFAAGAQAWHPAEGFIVRLLATAHDHGIVGKRIFDWQIGLVALEHGTTEFWTHDRTFRAPPGLRLVDPLA